ncbi:energy transducer TonB [Flavilitoribacter nigricans]|uniref:TonB C-terminal domain-containing protein n=1 Tax=Flavilitoribacter nigricans (strain ATCC 23147 / DSM 23189 / NBRC 102662 / NCIMB 1420 / SS-2) TaxID=1122177 RepID=A0A2D0NG75_FLAN2|nr:energy transducer TonB [Flavilitoribacter nigricans]PHN07169.1 hypothetical protein CRP01_08055 [Flavilitoribacter nigricans DSM 23189 = NBRC 102662]
MKTLIILYALSISLSFNAFDPVDSPSAQDLSETTAIPSDTAEYIPFFLFADQLPKYPGGEKEMVRFIQESIEYPELAYSHGHEGTVVVEFVVENDGRITQMKILRSVGLGCDEAALAVFRKMPRWQPALQGGRNIAVRYVTPVKFSLF